MNKPQSVLVEPTWAKLLRWQYRILILGGFAAFLWSVSLWIFVSVLKGPIPPVRSVAESVDFESLLFGASSVALFAYSVIIGLVAFFGYDLFRKIIADDVRASIQGQIDVQRKELEGKTAAHLGLSFGIIGSARDSLPANYGLLGESVQFSTRAYEILREIGSKSQYMALNNLVFYGCELGKPEHREILLGRAEELREFSQQNLPTPYFEGMLTYCRAVCDLSEDKDQMKRAYYIASGIFTEALNERQRDEATSYATSLKKRLNQKT